MRGGYLLTMGVAGVLSGSVLAQLPTDPPSATRSLPPGYSALPTAGTPQHFASLPPVNVEIKTAIPANHEWLLKPEHGAYFISVKSFARPPRTDARRSGAFCSGDGRGFGRGDSRSVSRSGVSLRARLRRAQGRDGGHRLGPRGASSTSPSGTSCASKPNSRAWSSWNRTARSVTVP